MSSDDDRVRVVKTCLCPECPYPGKEITGEEALPPARKFHPVPCSKIMKRKSNRESDKRPELRRLMRSQP